MGCLGSPLVTWEVGVTEIIIKAAMAGIICFVRVKREEKTVLARRTRIQQNWRVPQHDEKILEK